MCKNYLILWLVVECNKKMLHGSSKERESRENNKQKNEGTSFKL